MKIAERLPMDSWFGLLILLALVASTACATPEAPGRGPSVDDVSLPDSALIPRHVLLISIEGLTPEAYRVYPGGPLLTPEDALAPTLLRLARAGVHADTMRTVVPATAYSSHATLVTGRPPSRHQIVADALIGERGVRDTLAWQSSDLIGDTLWRSAAAEGQTVTSLRWPSTVGASIEHLISDAERLNVSQSWLAIAKRTSSSEMGARLSRLAPKDIGPAWPSIAERDGLMSEIACETAALETPSSLWLIRFSQVSAEIRRAGPHSQNARSALARVDREMSKILRCFDAAGLLKSTAVVVVGDRSLVPVDTRVNPNVALVRAGLITRAPSLKNRGVTSWSAIVRSSGGSASVYAVDQASAVLARKSLTVEARRTGGFRIVSAVELRDLDGDPQAWFGLEAEPGFIIGDGAVGPTLAPSQVRAAGGVLPSGTSSGVAFVAWGAGVRSQLQLQELNILDVAPTISTLLGLHLEKVEGRARIGIMRRELVEQRGLAARR